MNRLKQQFEALALTLLLVAVFTGLYFAFSNAIEEQQTAQTIAWTNPTLSQTAAEPILNPMPEPTEELESVVDKLLLYDIPLDDAVQLFLYDACTESGVPYELALALIGGESDYQADIISRTNDHGLFQINQRNHEWLAEELSVMDFLDPEDNICAGLYILAELFEKYGDPHMVLMAYNMGEAGARRQWNNGVYTSGYSRSIMARVDKLTPRQVE